MASFLGREKRTIMQSVAPGPASTMMAGRADPAQMQHA